VNHSTKSESQQCWITVRQNETSQEEMKMELQQSNIENPIPHSLRLDQEALLSNSQQQETSTVIAEREDFVRRIEAYCDCV
jgi:hypothetical protein